MSNAAVVNAEVNGLANRVAGFRVSIAARPNAEMAKSANGTRGASGVGCGEAGSCATAVVLAKVTVMTVVAPAEPGVTTGGLKVAVAPAGKPEADIVTLLLKVPMGGTPIVTSTGLPGVAVTGAVGAVTLNCGSDAGVSVIDTAAEVEVADVELPE